MNRMASELTSPMAKTWWAARERLEGRRNVYEGTTDAEQLRARLEGRPVGGRVSIMAPEFREPQTAAEFWDARILERNSSLWRYPETPVLIAVAAAARESAKAAVTAVREARSLDVRAQWTVRQNIAAWDRGHEAARFGADRTISALLEEWSRLRLAEEDPDADE